MKKKILGGIAVLAIAVVAAFNVNVSAQEDGLTDVSLDNVEALAGECSRTSNCWENGRICCDHGNCGCAPCGQ